MGPVPLADVEGGRDRSRAFGVLAVVTGALSVTFVAALIASKNPEPVRVWAVAVGLGAACGLALYLRFATLHGWWPVRATTGHGTGGRNRGGDPDPRCTSRR